MKLAHTYANFVASNSYHFVKGKDEFKALLCHRLFSHRAARIWDNYIVEGQERSIKDAQHNGTQYRFMRRYVETFG